MSKKDKVKIESSKPELVYEYEALDGSDNYIGNIKNSFSKNFATATVVDKVQTHSASKGKADLAQQFGDGNYKDALTNISRGLDYENTQLKLEEIALIKNKTDEMIKNSTKEQIEDGCNYIINITEISTKNRNTPSIERKKYLESIKQLFTAIKEGVDKGFDKVKNGINFAFEKIKSFKKDKIVAITDRQ